MPSTKICVIIKSNASSLLLSFSFIVFIEKNHSFFIGSDPKSSQKPVLPLSGMSFT